MSSIRCLIRACLSFALATAAGCAPSPSIDYRVTVRPSRTPEVIVEAEVRDAPRNGLTFQAHTEQEVMRLAGVEAFDGRGVPIPREVRYRPIVARGKRVAVPFVTIPGPVPDRVRIKYEVAPDRREGDDHLGYKGACFGEINDRFALLTGRNLFLVPQGIERLRATVRFTLPDGWHAVTPWGRQGEAWVAGGKGLAAGEALVSGAIGLGRFRRHSLEIDGSEYRFEVEAGVTAREEMRLLDGLERTTRFVHGLFPRRRASPYVTVVAPAAESGDEITGEGSAAGQGGTLAPLIAARARQYADRLISARLLYPPARAEIRDPSEYWLADGIRNWYSWRAVVEAGLIGAQDVTRETAVAYQASSRAHNLDRNLERMYRGDGPNELARSVLAPAVLAYLDHTVSTATGRAHSLDQTVASLFRGRRVPSIWSTLPRLPRTDWAGFREQYVQGRRRLPMEQMLSLEPTRPRPPGPGSSGRILTIAFTGETYGFLENCGCKVNQSGGVARRGKRLAEIRRQDPDMLLLDAGSTFAQPKGSGEVDYLSRNEQRFYLRMMETMGYSAASIGATELALGLDYFQEMTLGVSVPYLSSNARSQRGPIARSSIVVNRAGLRIGIIGVLDPPRAGKAGRMFEANTTDLTFEDPARALGTQLESLRPQVDLVVVLGRLDPYAIRRLVAAYPGVDVVISSQSSAPTLRVVDGDSLPSHYDASGFLGRTLVLYTAARQYGLGTARIQLDRANRVASAEVEDIWLKPEVGEDPTIRDRMNRFYDEVGRTEAAQGSVEPLFAWDKARLHGRYVGAERCASCHPSQMTQWSTTKHAGAFKTLLDAHRHFQPKCVSCHVVGFATPHGYKLGTARETLANVQCEVCHGPGGEHVNAPSGANITRNVPERVCLECHNPEHSDHFIYAERIPKVRHDLGVAAARTGGAASPP